LVHFHIPLLHLFHLTGQNLSNLFGHSRIARIKMVIGISLQLDMAFCKQLSWQDMKSRGSYSWVQYILSLTEGFEPSKSHSNFLFHLLRLPHDHKKLITNMRQEKIARQTITNFFIATASLMPIAQDWIMDW
jgi:hypothetical protein